MPQGIAFLGLNHRSAVGWAGLTFVWQYLCVSLSDVRKTLQLCPKQSARQSQAAQHDLFPEKTQRKIFDGMCKIFLNLEPYKNTGLCTMITNNMELWI